MDWTEERVEVLRGMWMNGYTARQIAEKLGGVTRNAVIGKAHRMGLSQRPSPVKRYEPMASIGGYERTCQWPIGHPGSPEFRFCGDTAVQGKPYCTNHCQVAYRRAGNSSDAA